MLRLYDTTAGERTPVVSARPGELRLYAPGPAVGDAVSVTDLRSLLLADLIRRVAQLQRLMVIAWQGSGVTAAGRGPVPGPGTASPGTAGPGTAGPDTAGAQALRADCAALNIYPAEFPDTVPARFDIGVAPSDGLRASGPAAAPPGGTATELSGGPAAAPSSDPAAPSSDPGRTKVPAVGAAGDPRAAEHHPRWVWAEPVLLDGDLAAENPAARLFAAGLADRDIDPLALRFSLLAQHYRRPATLSPGLLVRADKELRGWREQVAAWAANPSKPMPARYTDEIADALNDDLDLPRALEVMRALMGNESIPPGAKFETFAHLDQVLGLDLAREVGR